ncbi:MAG TPA: LuxR C-terminal-related transcriptional regulator, partial [Dehalococcoidia bacterium]|nr:LuxR C-terminal-related transcriptional regulator [Dehalococcoidia bacterium]
GGLAEKFPHAEWLNSLPAESLAAIPLFKADSSPLGHLSVVHDRPLSGEASVLAALRLFGLRAAAELERSGVEKRLKESEERYRRLVEASPDIIYRYSFPNHRMEYVNPAIERISGHTATDFYNDPDLLLKMVAEPEGDEEDTFSGRVFHPSKIRRWKRADGTEFWTEARNIQVYDETGRLIAQEGVSRDVTKSVLAEQELAEQLQLLSVVVEAIPDRIFRLSEDGALHSLIDDDGRLPGNGASTLEELIPAESLAEVRGAIREALRRSGVQAVRYQVELDDHMESVYELRMAPTREGDLIAMLRDITGSSWMMAEEEHRQTREILEQKVEHGAAARNPYSFTFRELTVLHLLVNGEPDKQIARQLGISPYTVNRHVSNILMKMGASSRTEAGVRAVREKLLA